MRAALLTALVTLSAGAACAASVIVGSNRPIKSIADGIASVTPLAEDLYVYVEEPTLLYSKTQSITATPAWNGHKVIVIGMKYAPEVTAYVGDAAVYEFTGSSMQLAYENIPGPTGSEGKLTSSGATFYVRDHLGSVRMALGTNGEVQEAITYHSMGKSKNLVAAASPVRERFTGKEHDWEGGGTGSSGIDLDYFGVRYYDADIGQWTAPDPAREFFSGYGYSSNSVASLDPNGLSTWISSFDVVDVKNDGDLGIYDACTENPVSLGQTKNWDEFINPDTKMPEGTIMLGLTWDSDIEKLHGMAMNMNLKKIGEESKGQMLFDIKNDVTYSPYGKYTGKLLQGYYASARSAGNFLAGYNASTGAMLNTTIPWSTYMKLAGALEVGKYSSWNAAKIVLLGKSYGPEPWYGEIEYTGRYTKDGWDHGRPPK